MKSVYPIRTLTKQATALEAAIALCLADASAKAVHRVRTWTRRLEAQLELLDLLPEVPEHAKAAEKLRRQLAKLRRAAGRVRDLDVLCDKLQGSGNSELAEGVGGKRVAGARMQKESRKLTKQLKARRSAEAEALVELLEARQERVMRALGKVLAAVAPGAEVAVPEARLVELALGWFAAPGVGGSGEDGEEALHDARKAAKLVRYVLESAPKAAREAHRLAARFEALQQTGGTWHDLLTLAAEARKRLGKRSELAARVGRLRDASLVSYRAELETRRAE
jgi:CHAD domain-containing protein